MFSSSVIKANGFRPLAVIGIAHCKVEGAVSLEHVTLSTDQLLLLQVVRQTREGLQLTGILGPTPKEQDFKRDAKYRRSTITIQWTRQKYKELLY